MKKLVDGDRWADRWWRKNFTKDMVVVACWLWDHANLAGFVELDMEVLCEEGFLSLSEAKIAYDRLSQAALGYARLYERKGDSPNKPRVWIRNYVKVQIGSMSFRSKTGRKPSPVWKAIARELINREDDFPEVKAYIGYHSLSQAAAACDRLQMKKNINKNSLGESENLLLPSSQAMQLARKYWNEMKEQGAGCHGTITVESLGKIILDRPDMDWKAMIGYVIGKDLNGGVRDAYGFLGKLCMDAKWMMKGGKVLELDANKKLLKEKQRAITELHRDGKIDDAECEKRMKELIGWRAEGAE